MQQIGTTEMKGREGLARNGNQWTDARAARSSRRSGRSCIFAVLHRHSCSSLSFSTAIVIVVRSYNASRREGE
jgi:hypothetical protein